MLKSKLQNVQLSSSQAALTLSSIPNTYDDLYILVSVRSTNADDNLYFRFNNTTSNTSWRNLLGFGTGVSSQSGTGWLAGGGVRSGVGTNDFTNIGIYIPNYAGSTAKTAMVDSTSEENGSNGYQFLTANLWNDTAAINRIDFYMQGGSLASGSKVSLYGIKRGADGRTEVAATGGTVTTSGGFTIHTFNASGTFVANRNMTVDTLVVAGGGGGGSNQGGGGGAGGFVSQSLAVAAGASYTVTVGAGGTGMSTSSATSGSSGSDSIFGSITSIGGGRGGNGGANTALSGGSGGGGGAQEAASPGAAGTANQGFAGGSGSGTFANAGGGGGAGEAGNTDGQREGGDGVASTISGSSVTYAGGGAGGSSNGASVAGGTGGGGTGSGGNGTGGAGTANTGGGGGGGGSTPGVGNGAGGAGGSGVVIVRYLTPA